MAMVNYYSRHFYSREFVEDLLAFHRLPPDS